MNNPSNFVWVGSEKDFVDQPSIHQLNHIIIGRFGGNSSSGQYKNEDGCLVWLEEKEDWEFTIIQDFLLLSVSFSFYLHFHDCQVKCLPTKRGAVKLEIVPYLRQFLR